MVSHRSRNSVLAALSSALQSIVNMGLIERVLPGDQLGGLFRITSLGASLARGNEDGNTSLPKAFIDALRVQSKKAPRRYRTSGWGEVRNHGWQLSELRSKLGQPAAYIHRGQVPSNVHVLRLSGVAISQQASTISAATTYDASDPPEEDSILVLTWNCRSTISDDHNKVVSRGCVATKVSSSLWMLSPCGAHAGLVAGDTETKKDD